MKYLSINAWASGATTRLQQCKNWHKILACPLQTEVVVVKTEEQASALVRIAINTQVIAVDCEGFNLSRTGKLCLVQASCDAVSIMSCSLVLLHKSCNIRLAMMQYRMQCM